MIKDLLISSVDKKIPLPGLFQYLNKSDLNILISSSQEKQEKMIQYLNHINIDNVKFIDMQFETNYRYYSKSELFENMIQVIAESNQLEETTELLKCSDKLEKFFKKTQNENGIQYLKQIIMQNQKKITWNNYKQNYFLKVLNNCVQNQKIYPEILSCIIVNEIHEQIEFQIIPQKNFIRQLKKDNLFQETFEFENKVQEQELIEKILEQLNNIYFSQILQEQIKTDSFIYKLSICEKYKNSNLAKLFIQLNQRTSQYSSFKNPIKQNIRQNINDLLIKIYLDYAIKQKIALPKIINVLGTKESSQTQINQINFKISKWKRFFSDIISMKFFEDINQEYELLWYLNKCNTNNQLEEYLKKLKNKKLMCVESNQLLIYKMIELIYEQKESLKFIINRIYKNDQIKNYSKGNCQVSNLYQLTLELLQKLKEFSTNQQIDGGQTELYSLEKKQEDQASKQFVQFSSQFRVKFFNPLNYQPFYSRRSAYSKDDIQHIQQIIHHLIRYFVSKDFLVLEYLRYLRYSSQQKTKIIITVPMGLIVYMQTNPKVQCFLKNSLQKEDKETLNITEIDVADLKLNPAIEQMNDPEVLLSFLMLAYQYRESHFHELKDIFKSHKMNVIMLQIEADLTDKEFNSKDIIYYLMKLNQYVKDQQ